MGKKEKPKTVAKKEEPKKRLSSKTLIIVVVALLLIGLAFVIYSTVVNPPKTGGFKSQEQVGRAITNISSDIEDIGSILEDIDRSLG